MIFMVDAVTVDEKRRGLFHLHLDENTSTEEMAAQMEKLWEHFKWGLNNEDAKLESGLDRRRADVYSIGDLAMPAGPCEVRVSCRGLHCDMSHGQVYTPIFIIEDVRDVYDIGNLELPGSPYVPAHLLEIRPAKIISSGKKWSPRDRAEASKAYEVASDDEPSEELSRGGIRRFSTTPASSAKRVQFSVDLDASPDTLREVDDAVKVENAVEEDDAVEEETDEEVEIEADFVIEEEVNFTAETVVETEEVESAAVVEEVVELGDVDGAIHPTLLDKSSRYIWQQSEEYQRSYYRCSGHGQFICPDCRVHVRQWMRFVRHHHGCSSFKTAKAVLCTSLQL